MTTDPHREAWHASIVKETAHTVACDECTIGETRLYHCPVGARLHDVQMAAWSAWRRARNGGAR